MKTLVLGNLFKRFRFAITFAREFCHLGKTGSARVIGYTVYRGFFNRIYGILQLKYEYSVYHFLWISGIKYTWVHLDEFWVFLGILANFFRVYWHTTTPPPPRYIIVADYRTGQAVEKRQVVMIHSLTSYLIGNLKKINPWARIRRHQAIELFEKRRTLSWPELMRAI